MSIGSYSWNFDFPWKIKMKEKCTKSIYQKKKLSVIDSDQMNYNEAAYRLFRYSPRQMEQE